MLTLICIGLLAFPAGRTTGYTANAPIPPAEGGEWFDDFNYASGAVISRMDVRNGHLMLASEERLSWEQTYTEHFAPGSFQHTEAISDSVRLARVGSAGPFFASGIYTSSVFAAGPAVTWFYGEWAHSGESGHAVSISFRSGDTPLPDETWSDWVEPPGECSWAPRQLYLDRWECKFYDMSMIASGHYLQYRASFDVADTNRGAALYNLAIWYGKYWTSGETISTPISPLDLFSWGEVFYTATVPISTSMQVDVMSGDGTVLVAGVVSGQSLQAIDPRIHSTIALRVTMLTDDSVRTPTLDVWGVRWIVGHQRYLPLLVR